MTPYRQTDADKVKYEVLCSWLKAWTLLGRCHREVIVGCTRIKEIPSHPHLPVSGLSQRLLALVAHFSVLVRYKKGAIPPSSLTLLSSSSQRLFEYNAYVQRSLSYLQTTRSVCVYLLNKCIELTTSSLQRPKTTDMSKKWTPELDAIVSLSPAGTLEHTLTPPSSSTASSKNARSPSAKPCARSSPSAFAPPVSVSTSLPLAHSLSLTNTLAAEGFTECTPKSIENKLYSWKKKNTTAPTASGDTPMSTPKKTAPRQKKDPATPKNKTPRAKKGAAKRSEEDEELTPSKSRKRQAESEEVEESKKMKVEQDDEEGVEGAGADEGEEA